MRSQALGTRVSVKVHVLREQLPVTESMDLPLCFEGVASELRGFLPDLWIKLQIIYLSTEWS